MRLFLNCRLLLLTSLCVLALPPPSSTLQCIGQDGKPVDWFIVYKMPKIRKHKGTEYGEGVAQYYMDGKNPQWKLSPRPINATNHAIYYTLQQIYTAKKTSILYLMFNDETPFGHISLNHGHAKGTLGFDKQSGFWLMHSAPRFPPPWKKGYQWAQNACDFGQTFLCVSFAYKSLDILAKQLLFYYPDVYDYNLPDAATQQFPQLLLLVNSTRIQNPPFFSIRQDLTTLAGMRLSNFAKFDLFGADLYDALVAPTLKTSLYVESWQHGDRAIILPSNCSVQYKVFNVQDVALASNLTFDNGKDHSKYVVSASAEGWVCVGGINRETTQFKRGGGTMCFQNKQVWTTYLKTITQFEHCPGQRQPSMYQGLSKGG